MDFREAQLYILIGERAKNVKWNREMGCENKKLEM
jgi:hypothetical protein